MLNMRFKCSAELEDLGYFKQHLELVIFNTVICS